MQNARRLTTACQRLHRLKESYRQPCRSLFGYGRVEAASPPRQPPLNAHPDAALRQLANEISAQSPCPICEEKQAEQRQPCREYCPDCGLPSHCSPEHRLADTAHHAEGTCESLREWYNDEIDLRSLRVQQALSNLLPRERSDWMALNLNDWAGFFRSRSLGGAAMNEQMQRHVTKCLTYPLTIAQFLHSNQLYKGAMTKEGLKLIGDVSHHATKERFRNTSLPVDPNAQAIRIFILALYPEASLHVPQMYWQQLSFLFPSVHFQFYFISPHVPFDSVAENPLLEDEGERRATGKRAPSRISDKFKVEYIPHPFVVDAEDPTRYAQRVQALYGFDPLSDVFVMFHCAYGHPLIRHDEAARAKEIVGEVLATRCLFLITAACPETLDRDMRALEEDFGIDRAVVSSFPTASDLDTSQDGEYARFQKGIRSAEEQSMLWLCHPVENQFRSWKREVIATDIRRVLNLNWGVMAVRGIGRQVAMPT